MVQKLLCIFFFKQKTAYEMRISDWSSDVCSSDLDRVPLVDRKLLDRRNMLDASIVHQYVERAERRLMLGHHFGDLVGPGHVGGRIAGGHAELRFQSGALLFDGGRLAKAVDRDVCRSDELRVGEECGSTCGSRWEPCTKKKKKK